MMKRLLLAFAFCLAGTPVFAACAVTNLQVKDNAAVTAAVPYADDGSGASNCSPQIQIKQGGNVLGITAGGAAKTDGSATTQPISAASGQIVDGADATQGLKGDSAATNSTSSWSVVALLKGIWNQLATMITSLATIATNTGAAIPAGTNSIGSVNLAANVTLTDCSGTIGTGGTAQNAIAAQTTLHGFTIANIDASAGSGEPLWISFTGTAAATTAGSYPLAAPTATTFVGLNSFTTPPGMGTAHAVSIIGATTGHKFSCTWW